MGHPVVHFEVIGKDGKKLQEFYSQLFDWKIDANNPMNYGTVEAQEGGIGGGIAESATPLVTIYVQVVDLQASLSKAESLGSEGTQALVKALAKLANASIS